MTTQGIPILYTGLKISLMLGLIPIQKPFYLLGIPETVLYRRMSGEVRILLLLPLDLIKQTDRENLIV